MIKGENEWKNEITLGGVCVWETNVRITYGYWQDDYIIYQTISLCFASFFAFCSCLEESYRSNENEKGVIRWGRRAAVCV